MNEAPPIPRHLRVSLLGNREQLLRETRATPLYYLPGPIFALIVAGLLDLTASTSIFGIRADYDKGPVINGYPFSHYLLLFYGLLTLLAVLLLVYRYLQWISTVYAVTSTRVIIQKGILSRDFDEIPVTQVRGIDVHQTIVQRMLGFGTLQVSSEGGHSLGNEAWRGIPKPFRFQRDVENAAQNLLQPQAPAAPSAGTYLRPPGSL